MRSLAALAFVSLTVMSAPPALAQCRNGWCKVVCNKSGICKYIKIIDRKNYPRVFYKARQSNVNDGGTLYVADCINDRNRAIISKDVILDWYEPLPGTNGAIVQDYVCR